ncbi:hypothetical protein [Giesbergeria anulus]|uniref:Uncharacterized protein n=1 Tax=Giesbergeria anulus TaxID=180197 RepID=A0A1H9E8R3_9BURK|nr:hypothetical protein [Giesbergeria anulus]SEQ21982.1 hypothetical protein SAMN02982919_00229 [Giesbergeria anulus]
MSRITLWIITAALVAAFFCLCAALDSNDQRHGYPTTLAAGAIAWAIS